MGKLHQKPSRRVSPLRKVLLLGPHTCPWWFGYTFDNPVRKLIHDPNDILSLYVSPGQTVVDIGCGLGYFSLSLARLVGASGHVIALDVQPEMIKRARHRAERNGLVDRIEFQICTADHLGITCQVDFVLAFWVIHEVVDQKGLLKEVRSFLEPNGHLMIVEPKGHVSAARFSDTANLARNAGFDISEGPPIQLSRSIVCSPTHEL